MQNEVVIHVRVEEAPARRSLASIERGARTHGERAGDNFRTGLSGRLMSSLAGIGSSFLNGIGKIGSALPGVIGGAIEKMPPMGSAIATVLITGLVASFAPALGAAIAASLTLALGGGVLAAGIMAALRDPKVKAAFEGFVAEAKSAFEKFGEPFREPLIRAGKTFSQLLKDIQPQIRKLGETIAPVIDVLAPALADFLKAVLPGIQKAVEASVPLFETLAENLPLLGKAVSDLFEKVSSNGPAMTLFFQDFLYVLVGITETVGDLIGWLSGLYLSARETTAAMTHDFTVFARAALRAIDHVVQATWKAMSIINPAAKAALGGAKREYDKFVKDANRKLDDLDKSVTVSVRFRIVGQAAASAAIRTAEILHSMGYAAGGIVGAATGGLHGGLRMVGEHGPELMELPPGTRMNSNPDTERLLSGGGQSQPLVVQLMLDGRKVQEILVDPTREFVQQRFGGDVQAAYGR